MAEYATINGAQHRLVDTSSLLMFPLIFKVYAELLDQFQLYQVQSGGQVVVVGFRLQRNDIYSSQHKID